jgi:hypothetical protein
MRPHRLDPVSLIAGLLFIVIGGANLIGGTGIVNWLGVLRIWPLLLVGAGIAVLLGILRRPDDT